MQLKNSNLTGRLSGEMTSLGTLCDSSLNFELVYYIDTRDYTTALNAQQAINLGIMEAFAQEGIEFAFPSQTLYLEGDTLSGNAS